MEIYLATAGLAGLGFLLNQYRSEPEQNTSEINLTDIKGSSREYQDTTIHPINNCHNEKNIDNFKRKIQDIKNKKKQMIKKELDNVNSNHNNMIPAFGSIVKQNVDEETTFNDQLLSYQKPLTQPKRETKPFFKPEKRIMNTIHDDRDLEIYKPSIYSKEGELPFQQISIAPGLNQGYNATGQDGFHSQYRPEQKTVDELRVKPKITHMGRVLPGMGISKRTQNIKMECRNDPSFYENSPDRYFTTVGAYTKATMKPEVILRDTQKDELACYTRTGNVNNEKLGNIVYDPNSVPKETKKQQLNEDSRLGQVNRDGYGNTVYDPIDWIPKDTNKQEQVKDTRTGYLYQPNANIVYDPDDVPSETLKELLVDLTITGNIQCDGLGNFVYTYDQPAKETGKEKLILKTRMGNVNTDSLGNVVFDPNDIPRETLKEIIIDQTRSGNVRMEKGHLSYDPSEWIPKDTIKQVTCLDSRIGHIGIGDANANIVYDPNDVPKNTNRQQFEQDSRVGYLYQPNANIVYDPEQKAKKTKKEDTHEEYIGNTGYNIKSQPERDYIENAIISDVKEKQLIRRPPVEEGLKETAGKEFINGCFDTRKNKYNDINYTYEKSYEIPIEVLQEYNNKTNINTTNDTSLHCVNDRINDFDLFADQISDNPFNISII